MEAKRPVSQHRDEMQDDSAQAEAREGQHGIKGRTISQRPMLSDPMSVPEVRFGAVRRPGGVEGVEDRVVTEHPVADLVQDKDLLLVGKVGHLSSSMEGAREGAATQHIERVRALFGKVGFRTMPS